MILREQKPPISSRYQYQIIIDTKIGNIKKIKNENNELEAKLYPRTKKKKVIEKPKEDFECRKCEQRKGIEFDEEHYCSN